jgi:hypothetical protein
MLKGQPDPGRPIGGIVMTPKQLSNYYLTSIPLTMEITYHDNSIWLELFVSLLTMLKINITNWELLKKHQLHPGGGQTLGGR